MAMTQIEQIRALDETLRWFERELQWGVPPRDLEHLVRRIGQLFTAINCNGQLVHEPESMGYSVVGSCGERYQVQCVAGSSLSGQINVTREQLENADRFAVLFFNTEEIEIDMLLDCSIEELAEYISDHHGNKLILPLESLIPSREEQRPLKTVREVIYRDYTIRERENGAMEIDLYGEPVTPVKPLLCRLAMELDVPLSSGMERTRNTRLLGTQVIDAIILRNQKSGS